MFTEFEIYKSQADEPKHSLAKQKLVFKIRYQRY